MKIAQGLLVLALSAATFAAAGADAAANWNDHCAKCHGADGKGDTKMGKKLAIADLTDPKVQANFTDAAALKALQEGVKDKSGKLQMKPTEGLSADEQAALVKHVRTLAKQ